MLVVLDTSVLVAALRSGMGASFEILRLLREGRFRIAVSVALVLEYEAVLLRHCAELGLPPQVAAGFVHYLCTVAHEQAIHFRWRAALSDEKDEFILDLAVAARCEAIVTHNIRHFGGARPLGIEVITPAAFLSRIKEDQ